MATAPIAHSVAVDEYLNTSYEPDMEYVDGALLKRGMPTIAHNLLERILLFWFAQFEAGLRFVALHEVRTQVIAGNRYRLPDVLLCPRPLPKGGVVDVVPWAVIEIVSPDDTVNKTRQRFLDYQRMGVPAILQMDPEEYVAHRFDDGSMIQTRFESLPLPTGDVPFDTDEIFRRLRSELTAG